jgi:hypothetical protein
MEKLESLRFSGEVMLDKVIIVDSELPLFPRQKSSRALFRLPAARTAADFG